MWRSPSPSSQTCHGMHGPRNLSSVWMRARHRQGRSIASRRRSGVLVAVRTMACIGLACGRGEVAALGSSRSHGGLAERRRFLRDMHDLLGAEVALADVLVSADIVGQPSDGLAHMRPSMHPGGPQRSRRWPRARRGLLGNPSYLGSRRVEVRVSEVR